MKKEADAVNDGSIVLSLEEVSKAYRVGVAHYGSLREKLSLAFRGSALRHGARPSQPEMLWALRDVTIEARRGETLGIIGPNGAGKTTILKLASRITRPTSGRVVVRGRVASLIEVGAGFHPELTGKENVHLYGSILGMSRSELRRRFDEIVEFSGLGSFIDLPLKKYSWGMHARLGFAVAIHSGPDILLMDEVLAVGDMSFQRLCLEKVASLRGASKTVLFVSHSLYAVEAMCDRVVWLDGGRPRMVGSPGVVLPAYTALYSEGSTSRKDAGRESEADRGRGTAQRGMELVSATLLDSQDREVAEIRTGDPLVVRIRYVCHEPIPRPHFGVGIYSMTGDQICVASMLVDGKVPERIEGTGTLDCGFASLPLLPRRYFVAVVVTDESVSTTFAPIRRLADFAVVELPDSLLSTRGPVAHTALRQGGPVFVSYEWRGPTSAQE